MHSAAQIIRERGHCKQVLEDVSGRVCFLGAGMIAAGYEPHISNHMRPMVRSATERADHYLGDDPVDWNNLPERTADEVIGLLEDAAQAKGLRADD
jgi:hypothetical protein